MASTKPTSSYRIFPVNERAEKVARDLVADDSDLSKLVFRHFNALKNLTAHLPLSLFHLGSIH